MHLAVIYRDMLAKHYRAQEIMQDFLRRGYLQ